MSGQQCKETCRLCYYETSDITDIFSEDGESFDYIGKINKYLHLSVNRLNSFWFCLKLKIQSQYIYIYIYDIVFS